LPWWILTQKVWFPWTRGIAISPPLRSDGRTRPATVAALLGFQSELVSADIEPLTIAAMNPSPSNPSAALFYNVLSKRSGPGGAACCPLLPPGRLVGDICPSAALARLRAQVAKPHLGSGPEALSLRGASGCRISCSTSGSIKLVGGDSVILAVPRRSLRNVAAEKRNRKLVPALRRDDRYSPIVNAHFRAIRTEGRSFFFSGCGGSAEGIFANVRFDR